MINIITSQFKTKGKNFRKLRGVVLGDSISVGYSRLQTQPYHFAYYLHNQTGYDWLNTGEGGQGIQWVLNNFASICEAHNPTNIFIHVGINDVTDNINWVNTEKTLFEQLFTKIRRLNVKCSFACIPHYSLNNANHIANTIAFNSWLQEQCILNGWGYFDYYAFSVQYAGSGTYYRDTVHPNEAGYTYLAPLMISAINNYLT